MLKPRVKKRINCRNKGARGEREFANFLKENFDIEAERGQQHCGGTDSPDVKHSIPNVHFEVKRTEKLCLYPAYEQAQKDCGNKIPIVAHRRNRGDWMAVLPMKDLIPLLGGKDGKSN